MNNNLTILNTQDPALLTWPVSLPLEIALGVPLDEIRESYDIGDEEWESLKNNDLFRREILKHQEALKEEGYSYKVKAKFHAEKLLHTSWELIHDEHTPAAVKADLIKFTARVAGYDSPKGPNATENAPTFSININMNGQAPAQQPITVNPMMVIDHDEY